MLPGRTAEWRSAAVKWSGALTWTMGEEVVSEWGGGARAHTVTAQGGA